MAKIRRAVHFDFHTMPGIDGLLSNFDAEEFARKLEENHVEYINVTARCNIGFSYYNTKIGKKYPGLTRDILQEVLDACHKRGIGVSAYINAGLNHELAADNYGWCKIGADGRVYGEDKRDNFFRKMCYNSGYGEYLLSEIKEIAKYDVDGIFCDCWKFHPCYCSACVSDMQKKGVDVFNQDQVTAYQRSVVLDMCKKIIKAAGKKVRFYFNSMTPLPEIDTHGEVECLTSSREWGNDYFYSAASFVRPQFDELLFMSGRFANSWGDFGGIKNVESMRGDLYDALMNGFGLSFGDHLHPVYGLENEVIERIGKVFEEKLLYEPYCDGAKYAAEIGLLVGNEDFDAPLYMQGAARLLNELKIPFNSYPCKNDFSAVKLLIIPKDFDENKDELGAKIKKFAINGGKIVFCGGGVFLANRLGIKDGVSEIEKDESDNAYFINNDGGMRWAVYKPCALLIKSDGKELAKYVAPTFNFGFDGRQAYFYRPQGAVTNYSSVVAGKNAAYISFDILEAYGESFLKEHRNLLGTVIDELLPERDIICSGLPSFATVSLTEKDDFKVFHVKAVHPEMRNGRGVIEDFDYVKNGGASLKGEYSVCTLPDKTPVPATVKDGRTVFETGEICGYKAFLLTKS